MTQHAVFVGYRRNDAANIAGRIYDRLTEALGPKAVFKDVDTLPIGQDFGEHIIQVLSQCRVFLALIGPNWLDAHDSQGQRRLNDPTDWVRIEIETALRTPSLQVIPVLVGGATMPQADELPDSLRSICRLNAATVRRDPDFHRDMDRLIAALNIDHIDSAVKPTTTGSTTSKPRPIATTLLAVFVLGVLGYGALNLFSTNRDIDSATEQQNQHSVEGQHVPDSQVRGETPNSTTTSPAPETTMPSAAQNTAEEQSPIDISVDVGANARGGQTFNDCNGANWCPTMVAIPAGSFVMIPPESGASAQTSGASDAYPERASITNAERTRIGRFAVSVNEVTFGQWDQCASRGGCGGYRPCAGCDAERRALDAPVSGVSRSDAVAYVTWLSLETGRTYRLLTNAEWEYAARAGAPTRYPWGQTPNGNYGNFSANSGRDHWFNASPVGSFPANAFGLHDMYGNVWEWIQDCGEIRGVSRNSGAQGQRCNWGIARGGSWSSENYSGYCSALTCEINDRSRERYFGIRVARDLE